MFLSAEGVKFGGLLPGSGGADGLGFGQGVGAEVAAGFGPFGVLFGPDRADEADDRVAVGEDADDVGPACCGWAWKKTHVMMWSSADTNW